MNVRIKLVEFIKAIYIAHTCKKRDRDSKNNNVNNNLSSTTTIVIIIAQQQYILVLLSFFNPTNRCLLLRMKGNHPSA